MSAMKKIAVELLKDSKQVAGLASTLIYELSDKIGIAILPANSFNPDGSAIVVLNDGRGWWAAGDRRETLQEMLPAFEGASFTYKPELLEELVARTKAAILKGVQP